MDRYDFLVHPEEFQNLKSLSSPDIPLENSNIKGLSSGSLIIRSSNGDGLIIPKRNLNCTFQEDGSSVRFSIMLSRKDADILRGSLSD